MTAIDQDQALISDAGRVPVTVQRRDNGGIVIYAHKAAVVLSSDEAERLASFVTGRAHIERHPVATPAKARFGQVAD